MDEPVHSTSQEALMNARLAVCAALLVLTGCGNGRDRGTGGADSKTAARTEFAKIDPATAGTINGTVHFAGQPPPEEKNDMSDDPECQALNSGDTYTERAVVKDGKVRWVFVYVKDGLGNLHFPPPTRPAVLDQNGCRYVPHVLGIMVDQPLEVRNSDETLHHIRVMPAHSTAFNIGMPIKDMKNVRKFTAPDIMVPVTCDVHHWMSAWIGVLPHPFYAVTGSDGSFSIKGLPPGTYTVEAWHEKFGTRSQQVTLAPGETITADFTFKATS